MEEDAPPATEERAPQDDASLRDDLRLLAADAKSFFAAEMAYQKTRAAYASGKAKIIAALGIVAAVFVFFAIMATVVGTVIALGPILGLWCAMLTVTGGLLVITAICILMALSHLRQMKAVLSEGGPDGDKR